MLLQRLLGQRDREVVGETVQLGELDAARLGNAAGDGFPQRIDELLHLFAVGGRHLVEDVGLDGRFVAACRGAENLGPDIELVEQPLEEHDVGRETHPVHSALGLEVDAVGGRSKIVAALGIDLVVGNDELAALLEIDDSLAQLFEQGRTLDSPAAVHAQVDAFDALVVFGSLDGAQGLHERELSGRLHGEEIEVGQRIGSGRIDDLLAEVDLENRTVAHGDGVGVHGERHDDHHEEPHERRDERTHEKREDACEKCFEKVHDTYYIKAFVCFVLRS